MKNLTQKLFFNLISKNYAQLLLVIFLVLQNKIIIKNFDIEIYGEYVFQLSIFTIINALSFPGLYHFLRKVAVEKNDKGIIQYFKLSPFLIIFGISVLFFLNLIQVIDNYFRIYILGFVIYFFGSYDYVLLGRSQINLSRLLILFQSITFTIILFYYSPNLNITSLLYLHLILVLARNIIGWTAVIYHSDFSLKNEIEIKTYLIQKNLSEAINPIISKLDNIILGNISSSELGLYNIYKTIPNSLKSNIKLLLVDYNNKLIKSKNNYQLYIKRDSKVIFILMMITFIISIIFSFAYFGYLTDWEYLQFNFLIVILFSASIILKIINDLFWNYDIYVKDGRLQFIINIISKSLFVISLFIMSKPLGIFGIVISYLFYDLFNLFFSFKNLKSSEKV